MKIPKMWQTLAKHVKVCFVESNLALQRSYENIANERQKLRIVDTMNSDCVQYMLESHPKPGIDISLPPLLEEIRQEREKQNTERDQDQGPLLMAIYGYNTFAKAMLQSLSLCEHLQVHLLAKTVIEKERAEHDGFLEYISDVKEILPKVDFWLLVTPFDD